MSVIVKPDGTVDLPVELLARFGIGPGNTLDVRHGPNGELLLVKAETGRKETIEEIRARIASIAGSATLSREERERRLDAAAGTANAGLTTDEIMAMTRGED